ncbi:MAG: hypothetical protein ACYS22_14210 [Planctomycetota bacterium]
MHARGNRSNAARTKIAELIARVDHQFGGDLEDDELLGQGAVDVYELLSRALQGL